MFWYQIQTLDWCTYLTGIKLNCYSGIQGSLFVHSNVENGGQALGPVVRMGIHISKWWIYSKLFYRLSKKGLHALKVTVSRIFHLFLTNLWVHQDVILPDPELNQPIFKCLVLCSMIVWHSMILSLFMTPLRTRTFSYITYSSPL